MIVFVVHGSQNGLRRIRFLSPWDHKLIISLSQDRVSLSRENDFTGFIRAVSWARCSVGWLLDFQSNPYELFMSLCHLLLECFPNWSHVRVPWLTRQLSSFSCDNDKWKKQHKKNPKQTMQAGLFSAFFGGETNTWLPVSDADVVPLFVRVFLFIMRRSCTLLCMNTFCGCVLLIHTGESCTFTCSTRYAGQKCVSEEAAGNQVFSSRIFY